MGWWVGGGGYVVGGGCAHGENMGNTCISWFWGPHASTPGSEGSPSDLGMGSGAKFTCGGLC